MENPANKDEKYFLENLENERGKIEIKLKGEVKHIGKIVYIHVLVFII